MTIQQVQYLERKNYVRPMTDEEWGYKLFCDGGSLPADCTDGMLRGWSKAWRESDPFVGDFSDVQPAEYRADWIGA